MNKVCKFCEKVFKTYQGRRQYCSHSCYASYLKKYFKTHKQPWEGKERTKEHKRKLSIFMKGRYTSKNHPYWKGGRINSKGYIKIYFPKHPYNHVGYIFEHRFKVEEKIGKIIDRTFRVHHLNNDKSDNRIENLIAFVSESAHQRFHHNPCNVKPREIIFDGRRS